MSTLTQLPEIPGVPTPLAESTRAVEIPATFKHALSVWLSWFKANKSDAVLSYDLAQFRQIMPDLPANDDEALSDVRIMIRRYGEEHDASVTFPSYSPAHMTKDVVDPETKKVTNPAHMVKANHYSPRYNKRTNVTWHYGDHRDNHNGPVTVTKVASK